MIRNRELHSTSVTDHLYAASVGKHIHLTILQFAKQSFLDFLQFLKDSTHALYAERLRKQFLQLAVEIFSRSRAGTLRRWHHSLTVILSS